MGRIDKTPWTDETIMPWGKHEGSRMDEVPADYLDWLRAQDWLPKWPGLHAYIKANEDVIDEELANNEAARGYVDGDDDQIRDWEDYQRRNR